MSERGAEIKEKPMCDCVYVRGDKYRGSEGCRKVTLTNKMKTKNKKEQHRSSDTSVIKKKNGVLEIID